MRKIEYNDTENNSIGVESKKYCGFFGFYINIIALYPIVGAAAGGMYHE
jgi:hypothetical protein